MKQRAMILVAVTLAMALLTLGCGRSSGTSIAGWMNMPAPFSNTISPAKSIPAPRVTAPVSVDVASTWRVFALRFAMLSRKLVHPHRATMQSTTRKAAVICFLMVLPPTCEAGDFAPAPTD